MHNKDGLHTRLCRYQPVGNCSTLYRLLGGAILLLCQSFAAINVYLTDFAWIKQ